MSNPRLAIYENATEPVIVVGHDGVILLANRHAEALLEYAPGALGGMAVDALVPDRLRERHADLRRMFRIDPKMRPMGSGREIIALAADGREIPVEIGLWPDPSGDFVVGLIRDISATLQARRQLETSALRFRAVALSSNDILTETDIGTGVITWHGDVDSPLGYEPGEFPRTRETWLEYVHPDDREDIRRLVGRASESGIFRADYRIRCKNGSYRHWASKCQTIELPEGGAETLIGAIRDVTETVLAKERLEHEHAHLQEEIKVEHNFDEIIGQSAPMRSMLEAVTQVAETDATVLLLGETGTGKELTARALHSRSRREDRALIKVDCATLPSGLVESELFGHMKGAFTGAHESRPGRFELADGGTIFLDEIGELSADVQAKLLRVLQEGEIQRLGARDAKHVDVRVIAATNRDLKREVEEGRFRSDLYYRLNVFPIELPPLRSRREDIPLLTAYILSKCVQRIGKNIEFVALSTQQALNNYEWPGNVRELQNVIERAVILSTGKALTITGVLGDAEPAQFTEPRSLKLDLEAVERRNILSALEESNWKIKGDDNAASRLGMSPSTLRSRMKRLGIEKPYKRPRDETSSARPH